jgi:hypothetical protein
MMLSILLESTYQKILEKYEIRNCSISIFDIEKNERPLLLKVDDVEHLSVK